MNKDYKNLVKEELIKENLSDYYQIYVECDANDGDCIDETLIVSDLYEDELLFLVLCYLKTNQAFGYSPDDHNSKINNVFGNYLGTDGDEWFDWLEDYCCENDLLLFAGMIDSRCHSITTIDITHYVQSLKYNVELPSIDKIFDTLEEMIDYMNKLYLLRK